MYASYLFSDPDVKDRVLIDLSYHHVSNKNSLNALRLSEIEIYKNLPETPQNKEYHRHLDNLLRFYNESLNYSSFPYDLRDNKSQLAKNPYFWKPDPRHYEQIFVDISPETFSNKTHEPLGPAYRDMLTEKTAKPILACRPFMMYGMPNRLKELKKLGFQTFDTWWDEDYDLDISAGETFDIIMKNLHMISNWSDEKCRQVFEEMKPVLRHNKRRLDEIIYNEPRFWIQSVLEVFQDQIR
jgi:hypothetical protein